MNTRKVIAAGAMVVILAGGLVACGADSPAAAPAVGQNVTSINELQGQNEQETIQAYNIALKNVLNQYPATLLSDPLELQMLRERDLYLNDASQIQYIYIMPSGRSETFFSTVRGKVSSLSSQMTATDGVFQDANGYQQSGGGNQVVPMPQDDLSYGGTACGDNGIFWFDEQGGFHTACIAGATVLTESAPLSINAIKLPAQPMDPKILAQFKSAK